MITSRHVGLLSVALVMVTAALATGCRRAPEPPPVASDSLGAPGDGGQPADEEPAGEKPEVVPPMCDGNPCMPPKRCISYLGIAGASGPTFYACEIACDQGADNDGCPVGMRCGVVADGPGAICQPE